MLVQLANEQDFNEMDIDYSKFKIDKEIGDVQYGWYDGVYIAIKIKK
jgi:hypothetical protein